MSELQFSIARAVVHGSAKGRGRRGVVPPPVGGWNTRESIAAMKPEYALTLENFFPDRGRLTSRRGYVEHADTLATVPVETLFNHLNGSTDKLFAFTSSAVYDVSDPDSIVTAVASGITSGRWRGANMNGNSVFVNGVDTPLRIDGSGDWVAHGFTGTGYTASDLTQVLPFKNRLFFLEKDSSDMWYGALNAITGTLTKFPLGLVDEAGGNAVAIGAITLDTGAGVDDLLAVFMSHGSVLIYQGTDPSMANSWSLVGIFRLAPVVGPDPLVKLGGDLVAITADGYIPLLQFLGAGREQQNLALSANIGPTVSAAVREHADNAGWQAAVFAPDNMLLFNVPVATGIYEQHVQNLQTRAWCKFTGIPSRCWAVWKNGLYFGTDSGRVMRANQGPTDEGAAIRAIAHSAFNYLGSPYDKHFRMFRAHLESDASGAAVWIGAVTDFSQRPPDLSAAALTSDGTKWDTALWNTFAWAAGIDRHRSWRAVNVRGYVRLNPCGVAVDQPGWGVVVLDRRPLRLDARRHLQRRQELMELQPDDAAVDYVARRLGIASGNMRPCVGASLRRDGEVVAGVVFHDYRPLKRGATCELSGAVEPGVSLRRRWLRALFGYPFLVVGVTRLQAVTCADNRPARSLLDRLGFEFEGILVRAHDGESDAAIYSMTPEYCIWIRGFYGQRRRSEAGRGADIPSAAWLQPAGAQPGPRRQPGRPADPVGLSGVGA